MEPKAYEIDDVGFQRIIDVLIPLERDPVCGDLAHGLVEGLRAAMSGRPYYISAELGNGKHLTLSNDPDVY